MKVDVRKTGGATVVSPQGRVTIGEPSAALMTCLEEVLREGARNVIVDAARVPYMDSSGLGVMIAVARQLAQSGGRLGIAAAPPKLREILAVTRLERLFVVGDSEEAVAASMAAPSASSG